MPGGKCLGPLVLRGFDKCLVKKTLYGCDRNAPIRNRLVHHIFFLKRNPGTFRCCYTHSKHFSALSALTTPCRA